MAHALADETLRDIFALHLTVPDDAFASTSATSPFAGVASSSSELLVVCKRWMRVATPLLYETVILRSTAQAQALAEALKKNSFGPFIRKLRCEGGYGASVGKIIRAAPNISDFCFTLNLWSEDRPKPMCDAMSFMNPRRVVVISAASVLKSNAPTRMVAEKLESCLDLWSHLVRCCVSMCATPLSDDAACRNASAFRVTSSGTATSSTRFKHPLQSRRLF
jgi:hypothetical protein